MSRGWDRQQRTPSWVYALVGVLLTLIVVLGIVVVMLLGSESGGLAAASSTPTSAPAATNTSAPSVGAPSGGATPEVTPEPTPAPTEEVTPAPTNEPTSGPTVSPGASTKPTLVSTTIPHRADCNGKNGTGQVGMISINWATTGATGVRISIDPPTPATAYGYGFADYGPTGPAIVPFACGASLHDAGGYYHLYVVTTLHTTGYYQYRYTKVYQSPAPTATP